MRLLTHIFYLTLRKKKVERSGWAGPQIPNITVERHVSPNQLIHGRKLKIRSQTRTLEEKKEKRRTVAQLQESSDKRQPPKLRPSEDAGHDFEPPQQFPTLQVHPPFSSSVTVPTCSCPPCFSPSVCSIIASLSF